MLYPPKSHACAIVASIFALTAVCVGMAQATKQSWTVICDDNGVAILEVSPPDAGTPTLKFARAEQDGNRLAPQEWRTVAKFQRSTRAWETITAQRLSSGGWALAYGELAGGTNVLQYLRTDADLRSLTTPIDRSPEVIVSVRLVDQKPDERPRLIDVSDPIIVEHSGQVYLIGESYLHKQPPDEYAVWVAPARTVEQPPMPGLSLQDGRIIGTGENPRLAKMENRYIVAVQLRQPAVDGQWGSWVRLYASTDLEHWEPFPSPPESFEFYAYELCMAGKDLTLVGIVDTSRREDRGHRGARQEYTPPLALVTLVYDADKRSWGTRATRLDLPLTRKTQINLLPPEASGGQLKLIERSADGQFTMRSLAE